MESTGETQGQARSPSGWFPDPWRRAQQRFFDGQNWTGHVANNGTTFVDHAGLTPVAPALAPPSTNAGTTRSAPAVQTPSRRFRTWLTVGIAGALVATVTVVRMYSIAKGNDAIERRSMTTVGAGAVSPLGEPLAVCHDGTQAANSNLAATCSAHAGVDRWLTNYGTCVDGLIVKMAPRDTCRTHGGFGRPLPDSTPVSDEDRLAANVRFSLTTDDVRSVSITDVNVVATIKIESGLTQGTTKDRGRFRVAETLQALVASDLPPTINTITVVVLIDLVNKYGETHEGSVVTASYKRETLARIVFANIDTTKILLLADAGLEIDPSFTKGDGS